MGIRIYLLRLSYGVRKVTTCEVLKLNDKRERGSKGGRGASKREKRLTLENERVERPHPREVYVEFQRKINVQGTSYRRGRSSDVTRRQGQY